MAPRVVILVPRRRDYALRDDLWAWCRARWERILPGVAIYEGHHDDGPFNRSAALNRAADLADADGRWDVALVIDSDVFVRKSQVEQAIATAARTGLTTWAHRRWRGLNEYWTRRVVKDGRDFGAENDREDMDVLVERTNPISWSCCIAIPRKVWDELGGFDERFVGWGYEDMAVQAAIVGLFGHERIEGDVYHLWHDRPFGNGRLDKDADQSYTAEALTNARLGRRYMLALRRDHGLHDRPGLPASEIERKRDIANLLRDDQRLKQPALEAGLPDWSTWWPTLPELVADAKAYRQAQASGIAVVVTSGGLAERWPERQKFLRQTLRSLNENVSGQIIQRVVYCDWPDEIRPEVDKIAKAAGFYTAGEGHHGYTVMRQRLWRYLAKRTRAPFLFIGEDDFAVCRPVDLDAMVTTLREQPQLKQLALLRAAFYPREFAAGGVLESLKTPIQRRDGLVTHRDHFTANPSLLRRSITDTDWPRGESSERLFGDTVLLDPSARFAYLGSGEAWIEHLGSVRAGDGY